MGSSDDVWAWPDIEPAAGRVRLRAFGDEDVPAVRALARDRYVTQITTLPARAETAQAQQWIAAQRARTTQRAGFSFAIASVGDDCLGYAGLWLRHLAAGRATAGYAVVPEHRRRGIATDALRALTAFAWTRPGVDRVELHIEPGNAASRRTAVAAGYGEEALLRVSREIAGRLCDLVVFGTDRPPGS